MAKSYTISEAAEFLGIQEADVEDLVASGEVSFEIVDDEYRIPEDLLLKVRVDLRKTRKTKKTPPHSLMDDSEFTGYFEDFICLKLNEISKKIESSFHMHGVELNNVRKFLTKRIDMYKEPLVVLTELDSLMKRAVEKAFKDLDIKGGGVSGHQGAAAISAQAETLLDESLKKHDEVLKALRKLENRIGTDNEKVFKALERLWKANPVNEIKNRIDSFIKSINESIPDRLDSIKAEMAELAKARDKIGSGESGDMAGPLNELLDGQKRLRKSIYDLNLSLKNSILDKGGELAEIIQETPGVLEEIKGIIPALKEIAESRLDQMGQLSKAVQSTGEPLDPKDRDAVLVKLTEIQTAIELSGGGFLVPHVDGKLNEIRNNMEQLFMQLGNRQNKALAENITRIAIPADKISGINKQFQQLASTLSDFSSSLDNSLNKINQAVDKIKKSTPGSGGGSLADEERISRILESLDSLNTRMDETIGHSIGDALSEIRESQESFQTVVVNMNINNQKALTEKLTQLDRLNELIGIRDNVDEIAEQMQTFEAITADINQLVDERLQLLAGISEQLEVLSSGGIGGGENTGKMGKIIEELRSSVNDFQERFSPDQLLSQFRQIIDEQTADLRQNQDAAQKILVNLNVNSQKWLREKLEQMDMDRDTIIQITDRFKSLEELTSGLSEKLGQKISNLESMGSRAEKISQDQDMNESLAQIQSIIEKETKTLRQSVEATQKIVSGLSSSNQKMIFDKLQDTELPENAVDILTQRNLQILEAIIGRVSPDETVISILDEIRLLLDSMKENLNTGQLLEKMTELNSRQTDQIKEEQEEASKNLRNFHNQLKKQLSARIDQIYEGIAEVLANLDADNLVTSMGEVFIEGNELLKEYQTGVFNQILQNHAQLSEQIRNISIPEGSRISGGVTGGEDLLPVLEKLLDNQMGSFRKDLDGAQKILVNLNVNMQKQLLAKVQEIMEEQAQKGVRIDSDEMCGRIDVIMEEKLQELKENQETLLSLNMGIQKALKSKLDEIKTGEGEGGSGETSGALPILERVITEKLQRLQDSYNESAQALEKLAKSNQTLLVEKLDRIAGDLGRFSGGISLGEYLPLIQEGLAETYNFLGTLKQDLDRVSKSIKSHEGSFGAPAAPASGSDFSSQMEETLMIKMDEDRETLRIISQRIQHIIDLVKEIYQQNAGSHGQEMPKALADRLEEAKEVEQQILKSIGQLQVDISRGSQKGLEDETGFMKEILESVTETRQDQEALARRLETLSGIIQTLSDSVKSEKSGAPSSNEIDEIRSEMEKIRGRNEILETEKNNLQEQLRILQLSDSEGGRAIQLQSLMKEKDSLLEECYREKVDLREQLEKEKRDKYEIIQRYETEKKELIDSLALERIQREKDRAELELLRAESRKKKWW